MSRTPEKRESTLNSNADHSGYQADSAPRAQRAYTEMMLGDVDIPASQSIDDMWLKTSHFWINTYRVHAKRVEGQIASLEGSPGKEHPLLVELNKTHTHYRQALKNEEVTYRNLITELVKRWQLESLVKKQLRRVGMKVRIGDTVPAYPISASEKQEKLRLVSYALCSLGDMQRYRAQLKVQMEQFRGEIGQSVEDVQSRARDYYDTARYIDFESGASLRPTGKTGNMTLMRYRLGLSPTCSLLQSAQR